MNAMWQPAYARRAERMRASEIRELLKLLERPGIISFAGGIPDPELFPTERAAEAYQAAMTSKATATSALQYSVSEGYAPLRSWIAEHMRQRGIDASPDNILLTSGSQQALDFLARLLLTPGDTALVTAPTYLGALQAFSAYEPRFDTIRPDQSNRTPASFADGAAKETPGARVKFAYVVPDFANPTGETLSLKARVDLLSLADELDIPILEDTAYSSLRYEGEDIAGIQALDIQRKGSLDRSRVVYLGTFSKTVAPGLRLGWICAAQPIINRLVLIKQASDLNSSLINQLVMHALVAGGGHESLVARAKAHYQPKRDAMLETLARVMPEGVTWTRPEGGLFVWLRLPEAVSSAELLKEAVEKVNVAFVPGGAFFHDGTNTNTLRLSFSLPSPEIIQTGLERLATLIR